MHKIVSSCAEGAYNYVRLCCTCVKLCYVVLQVRTIVLCCALGVHNCTGVLLAVMLSCGLLFSVT